MYMKIKSLGGVLSGSLSAVSKPNFVRKSEVRKMKEKMRKKYVTEKQESTRWKDLDEIYKIYMLLHRSDFNINVYLEYFEIRRTFR